MRVLRVSHSAVVDAWRERERALVRRGVDVHLVSAQEWDEGGVLVPLQPRPGERVRGVRTWGSHPALFVYDPLPLWRALGEPWDVLDLHEEPFALATAEILVLRALRRQRAPYVLYSAQNIRKRYPIPFRWLERGALRGASGLSVCNREAGKICEAKGFPGRSTLIPLGVDLPAGEDVPAHKAPPEVGGPVAVGYAGRLASHKGVDVLLRAVASQPRLSLRLAGAGPEEDALRALAAELRLGERVAFVGSLGPAELSGFYASVDALAIPSLPTPGWLEQFGRVAVEAMAAGTLVVASESGALPDVVGGAGLLVPPGDPEALATALLSAADEPELVAELVAAGRERAASCSWENVADQYERLYRTVTRREIAGFASTASEGKLSAPNAQAFGEETQALDENAQARGGVEVFLVAYKAPELVRTALTPLRHLAVTVVDNSSMPEVAAVCEELGVRYLDSGRNGGFAFGVNTALAHRQRPGADVLLVNPDAEVTPEQVAELHAALRSAPDIATVGPMQVDGTGQRTKVSWPFPSPAGTWIEAVGLGRLRRGKQFVIGSLLMLRAEALEQVGGFDERFFLYAEETDWAYRASRLGWRHVEVESVRAVHEGAGTSTDATRRETHFHASQERYIRKHYGGLGWAVARAGQVVNASIRSVVLTDDRRALARQRLGLMLKGPVRAEKTYRGEA